MTREKILGILFVFVLPAASFSAGLPAGRRHLPPMFMSITMNGLTTAEAEVVGSGELRAFIAGLAEVEENYRRQGLLDRKKLMTAALRGALKWGVDDRYSLFVPLKEEEKYFSEKRDGEYRDKGKIIQKVIVTYKPLNHKIFYVKIKKFCSVAVGQFDQAVSRMIGFKPKGIVLDLRGNLGGGTEVAFDILYYLMDSAHPAAIFQDFGGPPRKVYPAPDDSFRKRRGLVSPVGFEFLRKVPIVILMDGDTASASEIVIGALREVRGAKLVGEKSYGKGIYQSYFHSPLGVSKMTDGRWFTPSGLSIHGKGFTPDFEIEDEDEAFQKAVRILR